MEEINELQNEKIDKPKKKRDCMVDLIRILACLIVVGVHVNNLAITSLDKTRIFWGIILGDGVTIFFIIMGFFLFKNKSFKRLLKRTVVSILLPTVALILVSELLQPWTSNSVRFIDCIKNLSLDYKMVIQRALNWTATTTAAHLWYIFTYLKIILMFPILRWIVKDKNTSKYVIFLILGLMIYTDLKTFFQPTYQFTPYYLIEIAMMYTVLGYEIYKRKDLIKNNRKVTVMASIVAIAIEILRYMMQYKLFERNISDNTYVFWNTSFACIFATALIVVILSFEIKNEIVSKVISFLGQRTFGIYLVHLMVIAFFDSRGMSVKVLEILGHTNETAFSMTFFQEFAYLAIKVIIVFGVSLLITSVLYMMKILIGKGIAKINLAALTK